VVGLIGPNGSGKTTLLNMVNGVFAPDRGEIRMSGSAIAGKRPSDLSAIGLSRTFQTARVFQTLTVVQNLFVPLLHQQTLERSAASRRAMELLTFVGLQGHAERAASEFSGFWSLRGRW
jgi:branched-chain amino acid transport system ATP-binding protein